METKKNFNRRAFVSAGMIMSGILLPFSGLINHLLGFDPLTVEKHFWMSVHNMSGLLFIIFTLIHIQYNWKALRNYANNVKGKFISKEAISAIILVIFILTIFASHAFRVR